MKIYFDNFEKFILLTTKYNTMRVYRVLFRHLKVMAQSQKNTYMYEKYYKDEKLLKEHIKILEEQGFVRVKEIKEWEG